MEKIKERHIPNDIIMYEEWLSQTIRDEDTKMEKIEEQLIPDDLILYKEWLSQTIHDVRVLKSTEEFNKFEQVGV